MYTITGFLDLRKYDANRWSVLRPRKLLTPDGDVVEIFRGLVLDGGSIPKSLWSLTLPPLGSEADEGFVWHDALYAMHRDNSPYVRVSRDFTRREVDLLMMDLLLQEGISRELAEAIFLGVRLGASRAWMTPEEKLKANVINQLPEYYDA
jgi:hypothetical protein